MHKKEPSIDENDLLQQMCDQAARADVPAVWQRRNASLQRLLARVQILSDSEFDSAFNTMESLVENFLHKKIKAEKKSVSIQSELQNSLIKKASI